MGSTQGLAQGAPSFCAAGRCRFAFLGSIGLSILVMISLAVSQRRAILSLIRSGDEQDGGIDGLEVLDGMEKWSLIPSNTPNKRHQKAQKLQAEERELDRNIE